MTLGEREQEAIRSVLAGLEQDVAITLELGPTATPVTLLAAGGREIDSNAVTQELVEAVCALAPKQQTVTSPDPGAPETGAVRLTVVEHDTPGPWPRTTIGAGLEYLGMPAGYELTTLVHAIVEAGRVEPALSEATLDRLEALERDVAIDVYVTPT